MSGVAELHGVLALKRIRWWQLVSEAGPRSVPIRSGAHVWLALAAMPDGSGRTGHVELARFA